MDIMVKGRLPLSHECHSRGNFKKDCSPAEYQKIEKKATGEEEATASAINAINVIGLTTEAELAAAVYEDISPATSSKSCATPKVQRRRWKRAEKRKEEPSISGVAR